MGVRTDVHGLGATLFHILTGKRPRVGTSINILAEIQSGRVRTPSEVAPWVPPALDAICVKAMAFEKADRYQTAALLAEDVRGWLDLWDRIGTANLPRQEEASGEKPSAGGRFVEPWYRRLTRRFSG